MAALALVYALGALVILPLDLDDSPEAGPPVRRAVAPRPPAPVPDSAALEQAVLRRYAHRPLARVFRRRTGDAEAADRIARALLAEARRLEVAPSLLAAVVLTENARLDPDTVSAQGATGLMQVMPFHAGEYGCGSDDLTEVEGNICHGARVFGRYLRAARTLSEALLRYNGCVSGTNTPGCRQYPERVLRVAGEVRREVLLYGRGAAGT